MATFEQLYQSPMFNVAQLQARLPNWQSAPAPPNNRAASVQALLGQMNRFGDLERRDVELEQQQQKIDVERQRASDLADIQMRTFQAEQARLRSEAQQRENLAQQPGWTPRQQAAIRAGLMDEVWRSSTARDPLVSVMTPGGDNAVLMRESRAEGYTPASERPDTSGDFKDDWGVYKDIQRMNATFAEVNNKAKQIIAAIENPGGFSDVTVITNVAKALDPDSVVQGAERDTIAEAGGLYASIVGMLQQLRGKGQISEPIRKEIRDMMGRLTDIYAEEYKTRRQEQADFLEARGRRPDILGREIVFPDFTAGGGPLQPGEERKVGTGREQVTVRGRNRSR